MIELTSIEEAEAALLSFPQIDCPPVHHFIPGLYIREITMPAGSIIIGHEHLTEHANLVMTGRALVSMNGEVTEICAPYTFVSKPGVRKALLILEDMRFITTHMTEETELEKIEPLVIRKSQTFLEFQEDIKRLGKAKEELK